MTFTPTTDAFWSILNWSVPMPNDVVQSFPDSTILQWSQRIANAVSAGETDGVVVEAGPVTYKRIWASKELAESYIAFATTTATQAKTQLGYAALPVIISSNIEPV